MALFLSIKTFLVIILVIFCINTQNIKCTVCTRCIYCPNDILGDAYIDKIDSLLKQKFKDVQYPISINKTAISTTAFQYSIKYDNNLILRIRLDTQTGKISILSYSNNDKTLLDKFSYQCQSNCPSVKNSNISSNISQNNTQSVNTKNQETSSNNKSEQIKENITSGSGLSFTNINALNLSSQTQQLINNFLCRKYFINMASSNIKLVSFKAYGIFFRLIYFINSNGLVQAFEFVVSTDSANTTISITSSTQITQAIHIQNNFVLYNAERLFDVYGNLINSDSNSIMYNSTNISVTNASTAANASTVAYASTMLNNSSSQTAPNPNSSLSSSNKQYQQITDLNAVEVNQIQTYLTSIFYKTYSKLTLIKVQSQLFWKEATPYKQFTSYRLTYRVQKYQLAIQTQPLFYQIIVNKIKTVSLITYDVLSATYINVLAISQVQKKMESKSLASTDVKADKNLPFVDAIILNQFEQQLGNSPSVTQILRHQPYYQLVYVSLNKTNLKFILLYDVLLDSVQFFKNNNSSILAVGSDNGTSINKTNLQNQGNNSYTYKNQTTSGSLQPNPQVNQVSNPQASQANSPQVNQVINPQVNTKPNISQTSNYSYNSSSSQSSSSSSSQSSLIYLSQLVNYSSGTINIPVNVSSFVNYSNFLQITNYSGNSNVINIVNYLLNLYGNQINNFMRITKIYNCQTIYRLVFEIRRFQNITTQALLYEVVVSMTPNNIAIISTQYLNNYVHQLIPTDLTQKLSFDSSNISSDLYYIQISQLLLQCSFSSNNQTMFVKDLLLGSVLKSVGRYLPFYVFAYSNGIGLIVYYDILNKKIQLLFVNKVKQSIPVSTNISNSSKNIQNQNYQQSQSSSSYQQSQSGNTISSQIKPVDNAVKNSISSKDFIDNTQKANVSANTSKNPTTNSLNNQTLNSEIKSQVNNNSYVSLQVPSTNNQPKPYLQDVNTLSFGQIQVNQTTTSNNNFAQPINQNLSSNIQQNKIQNANKSLTSANLKINLSSQVKPLIKQPQQSNITSDNSNLSLSLDLLNRNNSSAQLPSVTSAPQIIVKQIGISIQNMEVFTQSVTQISDTFWNQVSQFLNSSNIDKYIKLSKALLDYSRLKTIDYTQPLFLAFRTSTSNPYFCNKSNNVNYDKLAKLVTYWLVKQNNFLSSQINMVSLVIIVQNIFASYQRFVLMNSNSNSLYEVIVNNQMVLLSFNQISSLYQLTSDPYSTEFNISLQFKSQAEQFRTLKLYSDLLTQVLPVQINKFKQIKLKIMPNGYKYTLSYLTNPVNSSSSVLWFVTELIIKVNSQSIQLICHKIVPAIQNLQLTKFFSNLQNFKGSSTSLINFSSSDIQNIYSTIDMLIQSQNNAIFVEKTWSIVFVQLFKISGDDNFVAFCIKYRNNINLQQLLFEGKYNILHKYLTMTSFKNNNNGLAIMVFSENNTNVDTETSSIIIKAKRQSDQIFNMTSINTLPSVIKTKTTKSGQKAYQLLYKVPFLYQMQLTLQSENITISYLSDIQTGQYYDQVQMNGFHQIKLPQTKFNLIFNRLTADSINQYPQLNKSTILAVFAKDDYDTLMYWSIYQYSYQTLVYETILNKNNSKLISSGFNKNINIPVSGFLNKNCVTQNGQSFCSLCNAGFNLQNGRCYQAIKNCKNQLAYKCYACQSYFQLKSNQCMSILPLKLTPVSSSDYLRLSYSSKNYNCIAFDSNTQKCTQCQSRFYLNSSDLCELVQSQCNTYNQQTGKCLSCQSGYSLNFNSSLCQKASSSICKVFDTNGQCCQCPGVQLYILFNGICFNSKPNFVLSGLPQTSIDRINKNIYCTKWVNNQCNQCLSGTQLNQKGLCQISTTNCLIFDYSNQKCLTCVRQYSNINGRCAIN